MDIDTIKEGYQSFCIENKMRTKLIKAIIDNNPKEIELYQRRYIKTVNITNLSIAKLIDKKNYNELENYKMQIMFKANSKELTDFLDLLTVYISLYSGNNNPIKFGECQQVLLYNLIKWYIENHSIGINQKDELIKSMIDSSSSSVGVRNILTERVEINDSLLLNIRSIREGKLLFKMFLTQIKIFIYVFNSTLVKKSLSYGEPIPKDIILQLVSLNVMAKVLSLGFNVESYLRNYYETHDVIKETLHFSFDSANEVLKLHLNDVLQEVNELTNEFLQQKKK